MNVWVGLILLIVSQVLAGETREWTRVSDAKKIEAEFVKADTEAGSVTIKTSKGKEFTLALEIFSQEDRDWVEAHLAEIEEGTPARQESHETEGVKFGKWNVRYPAGLSEEEYANAPLCILYHPMGNSQRMIDTMAEAADKHGWILVGADFYSNKRNLASYSKMKSVGLKVVDHIRKEIPHHKDKVVFGGLSGGGWWSFVSTAYLYQKAAGVISFGGWMSNQYNAPYPRRMTVAMINGDKDPAAAYEKADGDFLTKKKKATVKAFQFPGGHVLPNKPHTKGTTVTAVTWFHETAGFDE